MTSSEIAEIIWVPKIASEVLRQGSVIVTEKVKSNVYVDESVLSVAVTLYIKPYALTTSLMLELEI